MAKMAYIYENNELVKVHADSLGEKDIDKKYYVNENNFIYSKKLTPENTAGIILNNNGSNIN